MAYIYIRTKKLHVRMRYMGHKPSFTKKIWKGLSEIRMIRPVQIGPEFVELCQHKS